MKNNLISNFLIAKIKGYIFIILTATILLFSFSKSYSEENVFTVNNVIVEGTVDLKFSRDRYIKKALDKSFSVLMSKILLRKDLKNIKNLNNEIAASLVNSFQIIDEVYAKNKYIVTFRVNYNERKVKKLLSEKNISFSKPQKISAVFFPILFINDEVKSLDENFFYKQWNNIQIENEVINFVLPLDDLDDISKIKELKNNIEFFDIKNLVNKYNIDNYVFSLMSYENSKLKIYLNTNFENNKISKNISYDLSSFNDEKKLNFIIKDQKNIIIDLWKESNLVNLLMPLTINIQFKNKDLTDLDNFKNILNKVIIIDSFDLEKISINSSDFKIYYYGNPRKLKSELLQFGYDLNNENGYWELKLND